MSGRQDQELDQGQDQGLDDERRADDATCPHCGAPLHGIVAREQRGDVERAGCPSCALQLVRRGGGQWEGIRG